MYDMYGVWVGLSKLNMSLGYLQCLFPQTMGFPWRCFSLGYVDGPLSSFLPFKCG